MGCGCGKKKNPVPVDADAPNPNDEDTVQSAAEAWWQAHPSEKRSTVATPMPQ